MTMDDDYLLPIDPIDLEKPNLADEIRRFDYKFRLLAGIRRLAENRTPSEMNQIWILNAGSSVQDELSKHTWERPEDAFDLDKVKRRLLGKREPLPPPLKKIKIEENDDPAGFETVPLHPSLYSDGHQAAGTSDSECVIVEPDVKPIIPIEPERNLGRLQETLDKIRGKDSSDSAIPSQLQKPGPSDAPAVSKRVISTAPAGNHPEVTLELEIVIHANAAPGEKPKKPISGCFVGGNCSRVAICPEYSNPWVIDFSKPTLGRYSTVLHCEENQIPLQFRRAYVAETENRDNLVFVDSTSLHVIDKSTLRKTKERGNISNKLVGLAHVKEGRFVTLDVKYNCLVFLDGNQGRVDDTLELHQQSEWCRKDFSKVPKHSKGLTSVIRALAVHGSGEAMRIALVDWGKSDVYIFDSQGNLELTIERVGSNGSQFSKRKMVRQDTLYHPSGAAFFPDGRLLISDMINNRLVLFDSFDGSFLQEFQLPRRVLRPTFLEIREAEDRDLKLLLGFVGESWRNEPPGFAVFKINRELEPRGFGRF